MIGRAAWITGLVLAATVAGAAVAEVTAVSWGQFTPGEVLVGLLVGTAFVAVGFEDSRARAPRNGEVHGAARPADQDEALRAARGETKSALHHLKFDE